MDMAAYTKTGFSFYAIDTDRYQDRKIKRLKKSFGCNGIAVYDYLLCEVYRDKGCYMEFDTNILFDVAEYFDIDEKTVADIVEHCGDIGLFNKKMLEKGVITSASIQRRYMEMCSKSRRKSLAIPEDYLLIDQTGREREESVPTIDIPVQPVLGEDVPIFSVQPVTLDDEINQLVDEDYWLDQLQVLHNIDKGKLKLLLGKEFRSQCIADGKEMGHANIRDAKSHFHSWLRMYKERGNNDRQGYKDKRRGSEVTATSSKDFEGVF